jgi:hypothetical protein
MGGKPILLSLSSSRLPVFLFILSLSCGYRAVYAPDAPRLHVKLVRTLVPDAIASAEVATGVREELARAGMLEAGDGWPRVELEVLRADEASEGIAAGASGGTGPGTGRGTGPVSRGLDVAVVARAWVVASPDAEPESDTGDMRAEETIAVDTAPGAGGTPNGGVLPGAPALAASTFHHADALRAAARRLGHDLTRRVLGLPAASDDAPSATDRISR